MTSQTPSELSDADAEALGVASALIKARTVRGFTQAQLSDISGVSRSAIKGYETGRNMPGSRELKALCRALHISPNALLFGTETPFSGEPIDAENVAALREILAGPEDAKVTRARLAHLSTLLTTDEAASLFNLVQALAVARHGPEQVRQVILGSDLLLAATLSQAREAAGILAGQAPMSDEEKTNALESFLSRHGHNPKNASE